MPDPIDFGSTRPATGPVPVPASEEFQSAVPQSDEQVAAIRSGENPAAPRRQERIPGYQFVRRLGRGGMGEVWLVDDIRRAQLVALKQMLNAEAGDSECRRFATEAQAMARMDHPQIASIYHIGEYETRPYFVMEYCPGGTLGDYLDRKPQPARACAEIAEVIARGIHHAHAADINHRDLKPGNILLTRRIFRAGEPTSSADSAASGACFRRTS